MSTLPTVNRDFFRKERFLCTDSFSTCNGSRFFDNSTNDTIIAGTAGNDTITNSGSNVTIDAGKGNDRINFNGNSYGSATNNVIVYNAGDGNDTINGFYYSNSTLQIASGALKSVSSNDGMNLLLHVGENVITVKDGWRYLDTVYSANNLKIVDASGTDLLSTITPVRFVEGNTPGNYNSMSYVSLVGSENGDSISNSGAYVTVNTGDGDDSINNSGGNYALNVTIDAGDGDDSITNTGSIVSIDAGDGNDIINLSGSNVTINGGKGNDRISLGSNISNNVIVYNSGDGNDTIYAPNYGNATLQIASGNLKSVTSNDGMNLLLHVDDEIITISNGGQHFDGSSISMLKIVDADGNNLLSTITPVFFVGRNTPYGYSSSPNVSLVGSAGSDSIYNSNSNVTIDAGDGNDTITNSGASVTIDAGDGNDTITNSGASVTIDAGDGNDSIVNSGSTVSISGGDGNDTITNSASNVTINGGAGNDRISLGSYNGSTSNKNNVIVYNEGDGNDTIYGLDYGTATLQIASGDLKSVTSNDGVDMLLHVDDNIITIKDAWLYVDVMPSSYKLNIVDASGKDLLSTITPVRFAKDYYGYSSAPNVSVVGSDGDDYIGNSYNGKNVTVHAGDGNDSIYNNVTNVTVHAGDGDDYISNSGSIVSIDAGDGNDIINLSGSNVTINGGKGNDRISLGSNISNNVIVYNSGDGNDTIYAPNYGNATLQIASGNLKSVTSNDGMNLLLHVDDEIITISNGG